ncbi:hypothetical protein HDU87_008359 [Geranomyces variabilis]|uniref:FAD-binding PCMH-type domain-containing protein n=1 Tax=Geranomyces variabilis TaxID=109894 RepID=A0AAD5TD85_9FUNG|nr:hypothetical protein HDU87_008359 [Geranomyces variabilis]
MSVSTDNGSQPEAMQLLKIQTQPLPKEKPNAFCVIHIHLAPALVSLAIVPFLVSGQPTSPPCKCLSADTACWPSVDTFSKLNTTVGGRLISIRPTAAICYPGAEFNQQNCDIARVNANNSFFAVEQPGTTMYSWFSGNSDGVNVCPIQPVTGAAYDATTTCAQGSVSTIGVDARNASDVEATVKFARDNNLRLVVRNTGHDQVGRSTAAGSLMLWVHRIRQMQFIDSFAPTNCGGDSVGTAVTLGAGEQWGNVYKVADARGLAVVGGASRTVGSAGGYLQGGGHGPLSHKFGLGADNALQFTVVTAEGKTVIANNCTNQDLFWALRGGGGERKARALIKRTIGLQGELDAAGVSGYMFMSPTSVSGALYLPDDGALALDAALKPFIEFATSADKYTATTGPSIQFPAFFQAYDAMTKTVFGPTGTDPVGTNPVTASRLIPAALFQNDTWIDTLVDAMAKGFALGAPVFGTHLVIGQGVRSVDPKSNAVNPAWRDALLFVTTNIYFPDSATAAEIAAIRSQMTQINTLLKTATQGHGTYANEANIDEPDFQSSFWGSNYGELLKIKQKYDPDAVFNCHHCVGSELRSLDGNCWNQSQQIGGHKSRQICRSE